jgi:hypothetical protein
VTGVNQDLYRVTYCATAAGATCTAAAGQPSLIGKYVITNFTNNVSPAGQPANQQNTFGVIQGYSSEVSPRQMQFAAKLIF